MNIPGFRCLGWEQGGFRNQLALWPCYLAPEQILDHFFEMVKFEAVSFPLSQAKVRLRNLKGHEHSQCPDLGTVLFHSSSP